MSARTASIRQVSRESEWRNRFNMMAIGANLGVTIDGLERIYAIDQEKEKGDIKTFQSMRYSVWMGRLQEIWRLGTFRRYEFARLASALTAFLSSHAERVRRRRISPLKPLSQCHYQGHLRVDSTAMLRSYWLRSCHLHPRRKVPSLGECGRLFHTCLPTLAVKPFLLADIGEGK